jgi:FkbM family methyltransferase
MAKVPSFAQGQEDLMVLFLLDYKRDGCYVDVGCFHPVQLSNTWLLYNQGWQGICVDPNPNLAPLYAQLRPRDHFVARAVGKGSGKVTFFLGKHGVHSSLIQTENSSGETLEVEIEPLQSILDRHGVEAIDLLSVDAEGAEVDILESFDWQRHSPRLVLVEYNSADTINLELQQCLISKGYQLLFINNWNFLFTRDLARDSLRLHGQQEEGALFPPIAAKINSVAKAEKTRKDWENRGYVSQPLISFIIQSHNKSDQVNHLLSKLDKIQNTEIILIDDGSELYHSERLLRAAAKGNHFILRCNDLYEVITYDRAMSMARGHLIVLMQDDDDFDDYMDSARGGVIFARYPIFASSAVEIPIALLPFQKTGDGQPGNYTVSGNLTETPNLVKQALGPDSDFPTDFQFAATVNRAPMWIRREQFQEKVGCIDPSFAPFQCDDYDICYRCWLAGLKVGWYPAGFGWREWDSEACASGITSSHVSNPSAITPSSTSAMGTSLNRSTKS